MAKQTKITKSARGEDCTLLLGNCSGNETVVLCHIGKNRGMSIKCGDHFATSASSETTTKRSTSGAAATLPTSSPLRSVTPQ